MSLRIDTPGDDAFAHARLFQTLDPAPPAPAHRRPAEVSPRPNAVLLPPSTDGRFWVDIANAFHDHRDRVEQACLGTAFAIVLLIGGRVAVVAAGGLFG